MRFTVSIICLGLSHFLSSQVPITLVDRIDNSPVSDALIFADQTDYNALSNADGGVILDIQNIDNQSLIVSHLNYKLIEFLPSSISVGDTLFLEPAEHLLSDVEIVAKSTRKRNRWLRQFEKDFLGINKSKFDIDITNPDVILFQEKGTDLTARAEQPLIIENKGLGYRIRYWLQDYRSEKDGTIHYQGKYFFEPLTSDPGKEIVENRTITRQNSLPFLLASIADNRYEEHFILKLGRLHQDGTIELIRRYDPYETMRQHNDQRFEIRYGGILQVEHISLKSKGTRRNLRSLSRLGQRAEQDMIQHDRNTTYDAGQYEKSYIFTRSGKLIFDASGKLLNSEDIKVYGYWGTLGMADVMPLENISGLNPLHDEDDNGLNLFLDLFVGNEQEQSSALKKLETSWKPAYLAPCLDLLLLLRDRSIRNQLVRLLEGKTGHKGGPDYYQWLTFLWELPANLPPFYDELKAALYSTIDPAFSGYFKNRLASSTIRMDEVVWGGVRQDGIPPLRSPEMLPAEQASYLHDSDIIFGISINGDHRAYPKRILGWHEMVTDRIGNKRIAGVYCTLCGTMIAYEMEHNGIFHDLGTSGFLYRSNKLMYDEDTQSLWNTIEGKPVIGPLSNDDIALKTYPVVTTTWGAWKAQHPETLVLSPGTGHRRDYSEGAAYREYYATDRLMFPVPKKDDRLKNKEEVLVIRSPGYENDPIAILPAFLRKNPVYHSFIDGKRIIMLTGPDGSTRAYEAGEIQFTALSDNMASDNQGNLWTLYESHLSLGERRLGRLPSHRIFWFAWYNAYPNTRLVK